MNKKYSWRIMLLVIILFCVGGCVSNPNRIKEVKSQLLEGKAKRQIKLYFDRSIIKKNRQTVRILDPTKRGYRNVEYDVNKNVSSLMKEVCSNLFLTGHNNNYDLRLVADIKNINISDVAHFCRKDRKGGPYWHFASVNVTTSVELKIYDKNNEIFTSGSISRNKKYEFAGSWNSPKKDARMAIGYTTMEGVSYALKCAAADILPSIVSILYSSPEIVAFEQRIREEKTLPSSLFVNLFFADDNSVMSNNIIDAGEESRISITIKNKGKGTAFGVSLVTDMSYSSIQVSPLLSVGDIQPGTSKEMLVDIKAGLDLNDGTVPFKIVARENRGYDSKTYNLNVPAAKLAKPDLSISNYKINDSNTGLASGNGNGIPENGETIELIPYIRNDGVGRAIKVSLAVDSINSGIDVVRKSATINEILPGQTVTGNLAFAIPRTYSGGDVQVKLLASDIRGASDARKLLVFNTESHRPVLAYSYRIIDRSGNNVMENGEEGEIEITPANNGRMKANNIRLELSSADLEFSKSRDEVYSIDAESKYSPLRFPFKVPRNFEKKSVDVMVKFDQQDFSGLTDNINIPIKLMLPDFVISHQLLDANNNGMIEQGESVDLIIKVRNTGGLDADNVRLGFAFERDGVVNMGQKSVDIGRIAAGQTSSAKIFNLNVSRRATPGNFPVSFKLTQDDFSAKNLSLSLNIVAEKAEVITVAGQKRPEMIVPAATATGMKMVPMLFIHTPRDKKRVASRYEVVSGMAGDDKGIAGIEVRLNGKRIDPSRGVGVVAAPGSDQKQRNFNLKIPLAVGRNVIEVTAVDIENLSVTETVTVYREAQRGEIYAAVIGIDNYRHVPNLKYAAKDARAFASYMRENMGLDRDHLFELYDNQATERNIESLLGTKLYKKADRPEDTIFIYFAGHGAPEKDPSSQDGDSIRKYILAHDTDLEDLYSTGIPMDTIAELFRRYKAERVVFLSDSCYSGGSGGRTVLAAADGWRAANISDKFMERIARAGKGRIIMTSSSANEVSQESDQLGHGYFTYYLIEGLKGAADIGNDGEVDVDEVYQYLNMRVAEATNGSQHPVKKGEAEGRVIIGRVKP